MVDVLLGRVAGTDVVVVHRDRALVANRRTARTSGSDGPRSGQPIGTVITLRDRSDLIAVQRQLGATRSATETLRAQTHEFDNQLHIISGLVQMGEYDEVREYVATLTRKRAEFDATITERIARPGAGRRCWWPSPAWPPSRRWRWRWCRPRAARSWIRSCPPTWPPWSAT